MKSRRSRTTARTSGSTFQAHNYLFIDPRTARANGIKDGAWPWVESRWGRVHCMGAAGAALAAALAVGALAYVLRLAARGGARRALVVPRAAISGARVALAKCGGIGAGARRRLCRPVRWAAGRALVLLRRGEAPAVPVLPGGRLVRELTGFFRNRSSVAVFLTRRWRGLHLPAVRDAERVLVHRE